MNSRNFVPGNLGGLGDMLPVEVLKACKGSIVLNIYEPGSQHVDKVDTQNFYGDRCPKTPKEKDTAAPPSPNHPFDESTPLSALFREGSYNELEERIGHWQQYLAEGGQADKLALTSFKFDLTKIRPVNIYMDLAHLINHDALCVPMSVLAAYLFQHSNLSRSEKALYVQLKRYRSMCK